MLVTHNRAGLLSFVEQPVIECIEISSRATRVTCVAVNKRLKDSS